MSNRSEVIAKGMTLSQYAASYGVSVEDFLALNSNIIDPNLIYAGDKLVIPPATSTELPDLKVEITSSPKPIESLMGDDNLIVDSQCTTLPTPVDVLYVCQKKTWYKLSEKALNAIQKQNKELDELSQKMGALYNQPKGTPKQTLHSLRKEVFNQLNEHNLLGSFSNIKIQTFLSEEDQQRYSTYKLEQFALSLHQSEIDKRPSLNYGQVTQSPLKERYSNAIGEKRYQEALEEIEDNHPSQYWPTPADFSWNTTNRNAKPALLNVINEQLSELKSTIKVLENKSFTEAKTNFGLDNHKGSLVKASELKTYKALKPAFSNDVTEIIIRLLLDNRNRDGLFVKEGKNGYPMLDKVSSALQAMNEQGVVRPEQVLSVSKLYGSASNADDLNKQLKTIANTNWDQLVTYSKELTTLFQSKGWGIVQINAFKEQCEKCILTKINTYTTQLSKNAAGADFLVKEGSDCLKTAQDYIEETHKTAQGLAKNGSLQPGCRPPNCTTKRFSLLWQLSDFSFSTVPYLQTKAEDNASIVECYLVSQDDKRLFITSDMLKSITEHPCLSTKIQLSNQLQAPLKPSIEDWNTTQAKLKKQLKTAVKEVTSVKTKQENIDAFAERTGSAFHGKVLLDEHGLVSSVYTVEADFMRFSAGASGQTKMDDVSQIKKVNDLKEFGQAQANINLDLFKAQVNANYFIPSENGTPLTANYRDINDNSKTACLGILRLDTTSSLYGYAGASLSICAKLNIVGGSGGIGLSGQQSTEVKTYKRPVQKGAVVTQSTIDNTQGINASVDAFAGVEVGISNSGKLNWKPITHGKQSHVSFCSFVSQEALNAVHNDRDLTLLTKEIKQSSTPEQKKSISRDWKVLADLSATYAVNFGIGFKGDIALGIYKKRLVMGLSGRIVCGPGASGSLTVAINPSSILDLVNAFTSMLSFNEFKRMEVFQESKEGDSAYRFLNEAMTYALIMGTNLATVLLMEMNTLIDANQKKLRIESASDLATSLVEEKDRYILHTWFNNLLPETKGKLFYLLTTENPEFDRLYQDLSGYSLFGQDTKKAEFEKLWNEESIQRDALLILLQYWTQDGDGTTRSSLSRHIKESFEAYSEKGEAEFVGHQKYLIPMAVKQRMDRFMNRGKETIRVTSQPLDSLTVQSREYVQINNMISENFFIHEFEQVLITDEATKVTEKMLRTLLSNMGNPKAKNLKSFFVTSLKALTKKSDKRSHYWQHKDPSKRADTPEERLLDWIIVKEYIMKLGKS
ncbi:MAG: LysM peptidoglycan-binding domain-containing protein [Aliivibrio sp.]|uniref:LysM peptidoglycan-binding domain-containing protein n=1 Tax=Aliivibrio sp. TaxID=1872443 RepID=UPI001A4794DD|nr:LysM peptidoglycan-binding domain-containing protein [Aliivibrio sp.]